MISVCLASYNGEKFIKQQIESILLQLGDNDELIISDDGSTDSTVDIINQFADPRIKLFLYIREKSGKDSVQLITTNFENALSKAKGEYIFLADQDDVWCENKVVVMKEKLKSYDYVVSDCYITDEDLNIISKTRFLGNITKNKYLALIKPTPYQGSCSAFRREVLEKALPFPKGLQSHDRWIGMLASFGYRTLILEQPLIFYRRHSLTSSTSTSKSKRSLLYKVSTRLNYLKMLTMRLLAK